MSHVQGSLGAVYYNFPHAGAVSGFFDGGAGILSCCSLKWCTHTHTKQVTVEGAETLNWFKIHRFQFLTWPKFVDLLALCFDPCHGFIHFISFAVSFALHFPVGFSARQGILVSTGVTRTSCAYSSELCVPS